MNHLIAMALLSRSPQPFPNQKPLMAPSGFTLVEVMVGILLTLLFLGGTTQAFVLSTAMRIRGQELNEATLWIRDDVEKIRFEATTLNYESGSPGQYPATGMMAEHSLRCAAVDDGLIGYGAWLREQVVNPDTETEVGPQNELRSVQHVDKTSRVGQRSYVLRRVIMLDDNNPDGMVIRHSVFAQEDMPATLTDEPDPANSIATFYSEVIPNASFFCP